jgi:hypothetical protein
MIYNLNTSLLSLILIKSFKKPFLEFIPEDH